MNLNQGWTFGSVLSPPVSRREAQEKGLWLQVHYKSAAWLLTQVVRFLDLLHLPLDAPHVSAWGYTPASALLRLTSLLSNPVQPALQGRQLRVRFHRSLLERLQGSARPGTESPEAFRKPLLPLQPALCDAAGLPWIRTLNFISSPCLLSPGTRMSPKVNWR